MLMLENWKLKEVIQSKNSLQLYPKKRNSPLNKQGTNQRG